MVDMDSHSLSVTIAQIRRLANYIDGIEWLEARTRSLTTDVLILPEDWVMTKVFSVEEFTVYMNALKGLVSEITLVNHLIVVW